MLNETLNVLMEAFTNIVDAHDKIAVAAFAESNDSNCTKDDYAALCMIKKLAKDAVDVTKLTLEAHDIHFNNGKFYAPIGEIVDEPEEEQVDEPAAPNPPTNPNE